MGTQVISHSFGMSVNAEAVRDVSWTNSQYQPLQNNEQLSILVYPEICFQTMMGIGGAFSELGWQALQSLPPQGRDAVLRDLFDPEAGAGLNFCRLPIGSSDFALNGYSCSEVADDYEMRHFSLARDEQFLIPFIHAAREFQPNLQLHASPWSPPSWMKTSGNLISGCLKADTRTLKAYALYLRRFLEGYRDHGICIGHLHIQNEPDAARAETIRQEDSPSTFPSCNMPPEVMAEFAVEYLVPELRAAGLDTRVWAGTFRTITGLQSHLAMGDSRLREAVEGAGFQYSYAEHVRELQRLCPEKKIMHTESVCYQGENLPAQAVALFHDFFSYVDAGCVAYTYWNMVLDENQTSSWGWKQNSLVVVDRRKAEWAYQPDYSVMRLLSRHVKPGARRIAAFSFLKRVMGFQNPDGSVVVLFWNEGPETTATVSAESKSTVVSVPKDSLVVIQLESELS